MRVGEVSTHTRRNGRAGGEKSGGFARAVAPCNGRCARGATGRGVRVLAERGELPVPRGWDHFRA